jgi:alpha-glucuronidase
MEDSWLELEGLINVQQFNQVAQLMSIQYDEAKWWRSACLLYFQQFSRMPFPEDITQPEGNLEEYEKMRFPYAPGN